MTYLFIIIFHVFSSLAHSKELHDLKSFSVCKECNLIVISMTSSRNRNMSLYNYKRNTTPNINNFFKNSYIFSNAFAPASLTFTDSLSLFYSLSPRTHGSFKRLERKPNLKFLERYSSLTEVLAQHGYKTAAFVSDEDYTYGYGVGRTFQYYFDRSYYSDYKIKFIPYSYSIGTTQLVPIVNNWLRENYKQKFFLFFQAYDMHCPYGPRGEFSRLYETPHSKEIPFTTECFMTQTDVVKKKINGRVKLELKSFFAFLDRHEISYYFDKKDIDYLISRYDAELNQADFNLKSLFDTIETLKLDRNSIIVFLAEHGDNLGENDYFMKLSPNPRLNLQRVNRNFPLAIRTPTSKKKFFQGQLVQTIDIAPSLLDMLGISPPGSMQGKSIKNILDSNQEINDYIYAYSKMDEWINLRPLPTTFYILESVHNKKWKLDYSLKNKNNSNLYEEKYFLFNLENDPQEKLNIYNDNPAVAKLLRSVLKHKRNQASSWEWMSCNKYFNKCIDELFLKFKSPVQ
jgi:arylsulfatase A-like enzyme